MKFAINELPHKVFLFLFVKTIKKYLITTKLIHNLYFFSLLTNKKSSIMKVSK